MNDGDSIQVTVTVTNESPIEGTEIVQLYIRDLFGSVTRPVKELKDFKRVSFKANESKTVSFNITRETLSFYRADMTWGAEPGAFKAFVGTNSVDVLEKEFELLK